MSSIKMVLVIAASAAMFLGMGIGFIKILDIADMKGIIVFCFLMAMMGIMIGAAAVLTEIESKHNNKPTATKKQVKSEMDEAYAAPEKE